MQDMQAQWTAAMRRGDFVAAWELSDRVLAQRNPAERDDPAQPYHRRWVWDGRPFEGRRVLVRCYHGLGDTLQFVRYLPALRSRASTVTLEVQEELVPLLAAVPGPDQIVPFRCDAPAPAQDCDIEIMELGHALRLRPDAAPPPYVKVAPCTMPPRAVGLCWRAGNWDTARSIPDALVDPILATGRSIVSLCLGRAPAGFINPGGAPRLIEQTAAIMAGLALIITVDTMVAHLAGSMGMPTWLLLPYDADWRWMDSTQRSVVYPSMQLFRQGPARDWNPLLARIADGLKAC